MLINDMIDGSSMTGLRCRLESRCLISFQTKKTGVFLCLSISWRGKRNWPLSSGVVCDSLMCMAEGQYQRHYGRRWYWLWFSTFTVTSRRVPSSMLSMLSQFDEPEGVDPRCSFHSLILVAGITQPHELIEKFLL